MRDQWNADIRGLCKRSKQLFCFLPSTKGLYWFLQKKAPRICSERPRLRNEISLDVKNIQLPLWRETAMMSGQLFLLNDTGSCLHLGCNRHGWACLLDWPRTRGQMSLLTLTFVLVEWFAILTLLHCRVAESVIRQMKTSKQDLLSWKFWGKQLKNQSCWFTNKFFRRNTDLRNSWR